MTGSAQSLPPGNACLESTPYSMEGERFVIAEMYKTLTIFHKVMSGRVKILCILSRVAFVIKRMLCKNVTFSDVNKC